MSNNMLLRLPFITDSTQEDSIGFSVGYPPSSSHLSSPKPTETFTMVFLDFDDTIIPTTIHQLFHKDLRIDLFSLLKRTEINELQTTIIESIESLKNDFAENDQHVQFAVISNGDKKWLELMLKGSTKPRNRTQSGVPLLRDFFEENGIPILSARHETYKALKSKYGEIAGSMFRRISNGDDRWIWKYVTFANVISAHQSASNQTCRRIVSIGDGFDEQKAAQHYAEMHHCDALHFRFLGAPTVWQLCQQWSYIQSQRRLFQADVSELEESVCSASESSSDHALRKVDARFFVDELPKNDEFECDNTVHCTGNMHQLPAIRSYFKLWMDAAEAKRSKTNDLERYKSAMDTVCKSIHQRMFGHRPESATSRNFRLILMKAICRNKKFNAVFSAYYNKVKKVAVLQQGIKLIS